MQVWYIHFSREYDYPPILYEVEIVGQKKSGIAIFPRANKYDEILLENRYQIKIGKPLWVSPEIDYTHTGQKWFVSKKVIIFSKRDAIGVHKKLLAKFMEKARNNFNQQLAAYNNYDNFLKDEKYISPFTGETV